MCSSYFSLEKPLAKMTGDLSFRRLIMICCCLIQNLSRAAIPFKVTEYTEDTCPSNANYSFDCGEFEARCKDRCGLPAFEEELETHSSARKRPACSCDDQCPLYGDCCSDFQQECPDIAKVYLAIDPGLVAGGKCRHIYHTRFGSSHFQFLAKCDPLWVNDDVRELCMNETSSLLSLIPVTDRLRNVSYNNIYCTRCNYVPVENILAWKPMFVCDETIENSTAEEAITLFNDNDETCSVSFLEPVGIEKTPRRCIHTQLISCHPDCPTRALEDKCDGSGVRPFGNTNVVYYRNEFCAVCSMAPLKTILCGSPFR